jgi:di- and tripeptidase
VARQISILLIVPIAADKRYVYSGSQSADNGIVVCPWGCANLHAKAIQVFSRNSLQPLYKLLGHTGSVLALMVVKEKDWLVSASSKCVRRVRRI